MERVLDSGTLAKAHLSIKFVQRGKNFTRLALHHRKDLGELSLRLRGLRSPMWRPEVREASAVVGRRPVFHVRSRGSSRGWRLLRH